MYNRETLWGRRGELHSYCLLKCGKSINDSASVYSHSVCHLEHCIIHHITGTVWKVYMCYIQLRITYIFKGLWYCWWNWLKNPSNCPRKQLTFTEVYVSWHKLKELVHSISSTSSSSPINYSTILIFVLKMYKWHKWHCCCSWVPTH